MWRLTYGLNILTWVSFFQEMVTSHGKHYVLKWVKQNNQLNEKPTNWDDWLYYTLLPSWNDAWVIVTLDIPLPWISFKGILFHAFLTSHLNALSFISFIFFFWPLKHFITMLPSIWLKYSICIHSVVCSDPSAILAIPKFWLSVVPMNLWNSLLWNLPCASGVSSHNPKTCIVGWLACQNCP